VKSLKKRAHAYKCLILGNNIPRLGGLSGVGTHRPLLPHELSNRILNGVASAGENAFLNLSANPFFRFWRNQECWQIVVHLII